MKLLRFIKLLIVLILFSAIVDVYAIKTNYIQQPQSSVEKIETLLPTPSTPQPQIETAKRNTLIFTGDINLGRCVALLSIQAHDYAFPFQLVAEKLSSADITVGSLDASISDESPPQSCPDSMNLIGPKTMVQGLQLAGFDVMTIATNHIKDCGEKGFRCDDQSFFDTIDSLTQAGIQPVGGGRDLAEARKAVIIEKQGIRFAFLGVDQINERVWATETSPGVNPISSTKLEQVKADVASVKLIADVVIVMPQWGTEYSPLPDEVQRTWAQELIKAGASLVIGNHPHVIQPMESIDQGWVFYALGNFVFDQGQNSRREGLVVQATFNNAELENLVLLPVHINYYTHQPSWTEGAESQKILRRVPDITKK